MAAQLFKYVPVGTWFNLLTTELNSLANNNVVLGSVGGSSGVFDNSPAAAGDGSLYVDLRFTLASGVTPTLGTGASVWLLQYDGTNIDTYDATAGVATAPLIEAAIGFGLRAVSTLQRKTRQKIAAPVGQYKVLLKNDGTGVTWPSSANLLEARYFTIEAV